MTHDLITKCATLENNLQIKVRTKDIPNNTHPRKKDTDLTNPAIFAVISLSSVSVSQDFTPRHKPTVLQYRIRKRLFVLANFDPHFFRYSFCFPFFSSKKPASITSKSQLNPLGYYLGSREVPRFLSQLGQMWQTPHGRKFHQTDLVILTAQYG